MFLNDISYLLECHTFTYDNIIPNQKLPFIIKSIYFPLRNSFDKILTYSSILSGLFAMVYLLHQE